MTNNTQRAIPCSVMRGGTSKGLFFLASDLPSDLATRDRVLLSVMGSPDVREIDGMGGGHPLTSKVAVVSKSEHPGSDVDYLFLQVWPDRAEVSDGQTCGNILAAVAPFALEKGLVTSTGDLTRVRIYMVNSDSIASAEVETPNGKVNYQGEVRIDGVPGTHAAILIDFENVAGSTCGALLPTGNTRDQVEGFEVTMIDNGMPVVCLDASDFGISGQESPAELESNEILTSSLERVRITAGKLMNLGDVTNKTVPKMSLLSKPQGNGDINTRTFIPHRCHDAIGVLGAVSVATATVLPNSVAAQISDLSEIQNSMNITVEHPSGSFSVALELEGEATDRTIKRSALLRTARMLMSGEIYIPSHIWGPNDH